MHYFVFQSEIVGVVVNQWILSRLSHMVRSCDQYIQSYDLHCATQSLYNFWFQDFCDLYLVGFYLLSKEIACVPFSFNMCCRIKKVYAYFKQIF